MRTQGVNKLTKYIVVDNHTKEKEVYYGHCPYFYVSEDPRKEFSNQTILAEEHYSRFYTGAFNKSRTLINPTVQKLLLLWNGNLRINNDLFPYASRLENSYLDERRILNRTIYNMERFGLGEDELANYTFFFSCILTADPDLESLEIFSRDFRHLSDYELGTVDFAIGFARMIQQGADYEELSIYADTAICLLNNGDDRFLDELKEVSMSYLAGKRENIDDYKECCEILLEKAELEYQKFERNFLEESLLSFV